MQYHFSIHKYKEKNKINIGTAGGMTRLSTGYTFLNIQEQSKYIRMNIENIQNIKLFEISKKYQILDNIFLKVLEKILKKCQIYFIKCLIVQLNLLLNFYLIKVIFLRICYYFQMPKLFLLKELLRKR